MHNEILKLSIERTAATCNKLDVTKLATNNNYTIISVSYSSSVAKNGASA